MCARGRGVRSDVCVRARVFDCIYACGCMSVRTSVCVCVCVCDLDAVAQDPCPLMQESRVITLGIRDYQDGVHA